MAHPLSEVTNILYLLALVILPLVLIGWHNHRKKLTFIIYLLLANTLSISPLIGSASKTCHYCTWAYCDGSWCRLKTRYLSLPTGRELHTDTHVQFIYICLRSRPVSPNVVSPSVHSNVETKIRMTRMTEWQDDNMIEWQDDRLTG